MKSGFGDGAGATTVAPPFAQADKPGDAHTSGEETHAGICPNCHSLMLGPFCAHCGQPQNTHRRSLGKLVHEFLADILSFDSRILRTAWALMVRPGALTVAFFEGRTQRYVPAVRLYLFVSLFFFVILSFTHIALMQIVITSSPMPVHHDAGGGAFVVTDEGEKMPLRGAMATEKIHFETESKLIFFSPIGSLKSDLSAEARRQFDAEVMDLRVETGKTSTVKTVGETIQRLSNDPAALNGMVSEWIPRALFLLLPAFALLLAMVYRRQRRAFFFVDHLVFALNYHSFGFVLLLIVAGLKQTALSDRALWLLPCGLGLYLLAALRRCYRQNWFWTAFKAATVTSLYSIFLLTALTAVLILGVLYG